jgi:prepilin-type processing-associated H-X9-DG protein
LLPAVQAARESARRGQCSNNERNHVLAMLEHADALKALPAGRKGCDGSPPAGFCKSEPVTTNSQNYNMQSSGASAFAQILPFIEQQGLYRQLHVDDIPIWDAAATPWASDRDVNPALAVRPAVVVCPSDEAEPLAADFQHNVAPIIRVATGSYAVCAGTVCPPIAGTITKPNGSIVGPKHDNDGPFIYGRKFKLKEISDGLSNTFFLGETINGHSRYNSNIWTNGNRGQSTFRTTRNPLNIPIDPAITPNNLRANEFDGSASSTAAFHSNHPGGANFAFGDGRVVFISDSIAIESYQAYSTRADDEVIQ